MTLVERLTRRQLELEEQMVDAGIARYRAKWNYAASRNDVADQQPVKVLVDHYIGDVAEAIKKNVKEAMRGKAGRKNTTITALDGHSPEVLAYLTCRYVINSCIMQFTFTATAIALGRAIEEETMMREFNAVNRDARKWVDREIKRRKVSSKKMRTGFHARVAKHKGVSVKPWTTAKRVQTGSILIQLFADATRLIKLVNQRNGRKNTQREMQVTPQLLSWVTSSKDALEILTPFRLPMIVKPTKWSSLSDGGYLKVRMPLITQKGKRFNEFEAHKLAYLKDSDLTNIFDAVHAIDCTAYKINTRVMEVMQHYFGHNIGVGSMLGYNEVDLPDRPVSANSNKEQHHKWRKATRQAHDINNLTRIERLTHERLFQTVRQFADEPEVYFPHQIDFRGRVYAMPTGLHPQGPDHVRSLLHFAQGKKITNDKAMEWLMIHGANCYGFDKCPMEERIAWVRDNSDLIAQTYHDPIGNTDWHKADKPWSFLAWCFDFIDVLDGKPSHVRVAMDGSCNGLQHFSAMTRDPIGAKAVNLANNERPNDIYQTVADLVKVKLKQVKPEDKWMADTWFNMGIDRKLTKRSVMVMPYGGTLHSTMTYLEEALHDKLSGAKNPFGEEEGKAVAFLSKVVYDATREVVIGGKVVMDWLQQIARIASKAQVHLKWTTPHGFTVQQDYVEYKSILVTTFLNGRGSIRLSSRLREDTDVVSSRRSCNGISPNFVHSLDACALMNTVNAATKKGVTHFHMIHDDYGTHAADTQVLADTLRKAFVDMYSKHDVLTTFRNEVLSQLPLEAQALVPMVPKRGKFNLKEVLKSEFFFA
jgi:DNA-directed RNA polymerase, mitochondrial